MGLRRTSINFANTLLKNSRYRLVEANNLYDWQTANKRGKKYCCAVLPEGAAEYLRRNNPRLSEYQRRYENFDSTVTEPLVWTNDKLKDEDISYFRGDNAYVWQLRGTNMHEMGYTLATYYLMSMDRLDLLNCLYEDGAFGSFTFKIAGKVVSRDLLDSIAEIYFLEKHLGISTMRDFSVLDIGGGYGRLAHRMAEALPGLGHYYCTDAVAASTFICEYYLEYRNIRHKASSIALDRIEQTLAGAAVDIAVNVHSFSECKVPAIQWWLKLLTRYRVPFLMVVPNHYDKAGKRMLTNDGRDISRLIREAGYCEIALEPKYEDPLVQKYAINPSHYALYELARA